MTRLPTPGGDAGNWGTILNEYLSTVHNTDGSLKSGVVAGSHLADGSITTDKLADASITTTKLASSVQTTLSSVVTTSNVGVAGGIAGLDSSGKVPASQLPEASGGTTPEASATVSGTIRLSGDLGGTASSPTVTKLGGVSLSGTPSAGQALVATSSTVAGWQSISTGGSTNPNAGTVWNTASDPATGATASSVKDGDMWTDGTTEPTKVLVKARVSGQWVTTAELTKPVVTTTTAPLPTTSPTVTDTSVTLSWTAPSQVAGTLDGYNVYEGSSTTPLNSALIPATTTSFTTITPLTPGTNYSFVIKAVSTPPSGSQTESAGLTIQATTTGTVVNPLPAPTGVTATAGNATASVAFNLVTGATSYTVTATPGGINKIGATSPITVDGLANGTSYTFTVSATDGTRTSAESAASGAVVPSGVTTPGNTWLSGMMFGSGAWADHHLNEFNEFATWRGRPLDLHVVFNTRNGGWSGALNNWWDIRPNAQTKIAVAFSTWQEGGDVNAAARGEYNDFYRQFALQCKPGDYIRINHEFNISNYHHKLTPANKDAWRAAWTHAYDTMKLANPEVKIIFNPNHGGDQNGNSLTDGYVEDKVDIIALDMYDFWSAVRSESDWINDKVNKEGGLKYWLDFAIARGKKFALCEWGVTHENTGGGDNPFYIQKVYEWLRANKEHIDHEAYYNARDDRGFRLLPSDLNPNSAAEYLEQVNLTIA